MNSDFLPWQREADNVGVEFLDCHFVGIPGVLRRSVDFVHITLLADDQAVSDPGAASWGSNWNVSFSAKVVVTEKGK